METFQQFMDRINSFEKKEIDFGNEIFKGSPSIALKVNKDNTFNNFYGDTVVFALNKSVKEKLAEYVDLLYKAAPRCFCERLVPHTFHVTLHDLSNSPILEDIAEEVFLNELNVVDRINGIRKFNIKQIKMKSTYIFNMVNTSLVLGLYPADEDSYHSLMELYAIFDGVKKLNYPLTPHITLAYYNVEGFDVKSAKNLENTVNLINRDINIEMTVKDLFYQKFTSMNDYIDIIKLM